MGKAKKEHRKKVQARNEKINQEKKKVEKIKREWIKNLIEEERKKGLFENNPDGNKTSNTDILDGPTI
jgi:hypothetical protein